MLENASAPRTYSLVGIRHTLGRFSSFIQIVLKDILEHAVSYGSAFRHTLAGILNPFLTIFLRKDNIPSQER